MNVNSSVLIRNLVVVVTILLILIIYYLIHIGNRYVDDSNRIRINKKKILPAIFSIVIIYIFYFLAKRYSIIVDTIYTIITSAVLAYLFNPIVNYLEKRRISRGWGAIIVYLVIIGVILILSFSVFPRTAKEVRRFISILPMYFEKITDFIDDIYYRYYISIDNMPPIIQGIEAVILNSISNLESVIITSVSKFIEGIISTFSKVVSLILIPILTFYFIKDKEYFKANLYLLMPKKYRKEVKELSIEIDRVLSQFIRGRFILAVYVGIATTILLLILRIDFAVVIGIITGIADIIPYFGPFLGFLPAVFFAFVSSPIKALWVAIMFIGIQWVENNVLAPKIIGETTGMHPIIILLSLIIGGGVFGVMGMIFSVPVVAVFKILLGFFLERIRMKNL
ncbi:AI-2E family transporter [Tepidimicrobium xylanilyticum]|uniref:Predicted PurR-regulated permease PerM n=1 Tax=Tepidimicrobium xylanilyticum TaxID=1123352 RepID=A0A1H2SIY8_9FIRM|nr:AI-2E family transporter [Tepidimicrobium xylanilyticum]SDW31663.1 Predicted PurR-regulated permease PerM [Tepidimicrobium xylanilyticum]